jgi:hypothetical protein
MANIIISTAVNIGLGYVMRALAPDTYSETEGQRLGNSQVTGAAEGVAIPRIEGKFRVAGQLIWATNFLEKIIVKKTTTGGGKGSGPTQTTKETSYKYYCSFAVGLCESRGGFKLKSIYLDGTKISLSKLKYRFYSGSETQNPDPKMVAVEGVGNVPAYRDLCYVVFDELELTNYGNRIPQVAVEIEAPASITATPDSLDAKLKSVHLAPGVGEFAYSTETVSEVSSSSTSSALNSNAGGDPDIITSLDQLNAEAPNVNSASVVVSWFGDSLNTAACELRPRVEKSNRTAKPSSWRVSDRTRSNTQLVSTDQNGKPAIGGTPSDKSVRQAVQEIKRRGMRAMFYPLIKIEIPNSQDRALPVLNPGAENGTASWINELGNLGTNVSLSNQFSYPAPRSGSAYFSSADTVNFRSYQTLNLSASDFGKTLRVNWYQASFTFANDDGYLSVRFYDAQGVEIGSEIQSPPLSPGQAWLLRTLSTTIPSGARRLRIYINGVYLVGTANTDAYFDDISAVVEDSAGAAEYPWRGRVQGSSAGFMGTVGPSNFGTWDGTNVPYNGPANEWSHRRMTLHYARLLADILTSGDAFIVASQMVGVTNSDPTWGSEIASLIADVRTILRPGVLVSYAADWTEYKSPVLAPVWTSASFIGIDNYLPITDWSDGDESYSVESFKQGIDSGEYWDYSYADDNAREAGIRTLITNPASRQKDIRYWRTNNYPAKPVWFTQFGCPAVDKGANQPSVFFDLDSGEALFPYRSSGDRNDAVQRLYLRAMIEYWTADGLVAPENMFLWCWDARPFPQFPALATVWPDGENWSRGHWIIGRLGLTTLAQTVGRIMQRAGFLTADYDVLDLELSGILVSGMGVFEVTTYRDVLENLMRTYNFDVLESSGKFKFVMRGAPDQVQINIDDLVVSGDNSFAKTRTQDLELPDRTTVRFLDPSRNYSVTVVDGHTVTGDSNKIDNFTSNSVISVSYAKRLADIITQEAWVAKNKISFSLPTTYLRVEPGDVFEFQFDGVTRRYRVQSLTFGDQIDVEAIGYAESLYRTDVFADTDPTVDFTVPFGSSLVIFAELPVPDDRLPNLWSPRVLVAQDPWPGSVLIYEDDQAGGFLLNSVQPIPAIVGFSNTPLERGPTEVWDRASSVNVKFDDEDFSLVSTTEAAVLNGANVLAILTPFGEWEVFQFADALLEPDGSFTLSKFLRGRLGTEPYMGNPTPAGSRVVVYDAERFGTISGSDDRLGVPFDCRYGPAEIDVTDNRYVDQIVTPRGVAYRPYSPVHLRQTRVGNNIQLSWTRRTRIGGDNWLDGEVPLSEETERYEIEIDGGRTISVVGSNSIVYTEAEQIVDFGAAQVQVNWTIYQMSDRFGRGAPANG